MQPDAVAGPSDAVFDGVHVWTVNDLDSTVTKLRTSDGAILGTFPVGLGRPARSRRDDPRHLPGGNRSSQHRLIVFDGDSLWITNRADATVTQLRASDGSLVGAIPAGLAFAGANIRVTNHGDDTVSKL